MTQLQTTTDRPAESWTTEIPVYRRHRIRKALLAGESVKQVSALFGIPERTLRHWRSSPDFQRDVLAQHKRLQEEIGTEFVNAAADSIAALRLVVNNPKSKDRDRIGAAGKILTLYLKHAAILNAAELPEPVSATESGVQVGSMAEEPRRAFEATPADAPESPNLPPHLKRFAGDLPGLVSAPPPVAPAAEPSTISPEDLQPFSRRDRSLDLRDLNGALNGTPGSNGNHRNGLAGATNGKHHR